MTIQNLPKRKNIKQHCWEIRTSSDLTTPTRHHYIDNPNWRVFRNLSIHFSLRLSTGLIQHPGPPHKGAIISILRKLPQDLQNIFCEKVNNTQKRNIMQNRHRLVINILKIITWYFLPTGSYSHSSQNTPSFINLHQQKKYRNNGLL